MPSKPGFRLGIYMCKDLEIVDFAAPYGVFSVARRLDPELDAFFVAEALRPVQAQAGFTIMHLKRIDRLLEDTAETQFDDRQMAFRCF